MLETILPYIQYLSLILFLALIIYLVSVHAETVIEHYLPKIRNFFTKSPEKFIQRSKPDTSVNEEQSRDERMSEILKRQREIIKREKERLERDKKWKKERSKVQHSSADAESKSAVRKNTSNTKRSKNNQGKKPGNNVGGQKKADQDDVKRLKIDRNEKKVTSKENVTENNKSEKPVNGELKRKSPGYTAKGTAVATSDYKDIHYVTYHKPETFIQSGNWQYPVAKFPEYGCIMKPPVNAKFEYRGYKEKEFERCLRSLLPGKLDISGQYALPAGPDTRPFEPDIAIIHKTDDTQIFIDVEIDEPYGAVSRKPIHQTGNGDEARDVYFKDRGWIVIRFAEIQVHQQPKECVGFIAKILKEIAPELLLHQDLLNKDSYPDIVDQWDSIQAEEWASENYRETYLAIDRFGRRHRREVITGIELRDIDIHIEQEVKKTSVTFENGSSSMVAKLKHPRDTRIEFDPEPHQYYIDGSPARSVSSIIDEFFPVFNPQQAAEKYLNNRGLDLSGKAELIDQWNQKGKLSRDRGTRLHSLIEHYFANGKLPNEDELKSELNLFNRFLNDYTGTNPVRTEWRIFDERVRVAGTIDMLSDNRNGTYDMYDWKRSKKVVDMNGLPITENPYQSGFGQLSKLADTSYNRYCLQQSIYKFILESTYGLKIGNMNLIVLHPIYQTYHKVEVPYWEKAVRYILDHV